MAEHFFLQVKVKSKRENHVLMCFVCAFGKTLWTEPTLHFVLKKLIISCIQTFLLAEVLLHFWSFIGSKVKCIFSHIISSLTWKNIYQMSNILKAFSLQVLNSSSVHVFNGCSWILSHHSPLNYPEDILNIE